MLRHAGARLDRADEESSRETKVEEMNEGEEDEEEPANAFGAGSARSTEFKVRVCAASLAPAPASSTALRVNVVGASPGQRAVPCVVCRVLCAVCCVPCAVCRVLCALCALQICGCVCCVRCVQIVVGRDDGPCAPQAIAAFLSLHGSVSSNLYMYTCWPYAGLV